MELKEADALMQKITEYGFALIDLGLYLDTHPGESVACAIYDDAARQLEAFKEHYVKEYAPLKVGDSTQQWVWNCFWPWDIR